MALNQVFFDAVRSNDVRVARKMLYLGADPNYRDALHYSINRGYSRMAVALLKRGGDADSLNDKKDNAIISFLKRVRNKRCHLSNSVLEELIKNTKNIMQTDCEGNTAMVYCSKLVDKIDTHLIEMIAKKSIPPVSCKTESKSTFFRNYHLIGVAFASILTPIMASKELRAP